MLIIELILFAAVALVSLPYLLNPFLLKWMLREHTEARLEPMHRENLPEEVKEYYAFVEPDFTSLGFFHCNLARLQNYSETGEIFISSWLNRPEGISGSAMVSYLKLRNQPVKVFARTIALTTRFTEDVSWETSNWDTPNPLVQMPTRRCIQIPELKKLPELLAAHRILAKRFNPSSERLLPAEGEELPTMARKMTELIRYQAQSGMRFLDANSNLYRPTWKGALINAWQQTWPVNTIRKWLLIKSGQRVLNSIQAPNV